MSVEPFNVPPWIDDVEPLSDNEIEQLVDGHRERSDAAAQEALRVYPVWLANQKKNKKKKGNK